MAKVRIKVSDWTFRAVQGMEVLTINPQYFRLRRPLERRIYELARKHVGDQARPFRIGLDKLPAQGRKQLTDEEVQVLPQADRPVTGTSPTTMSRSKETWATFTTKRAGFAATPSLFDFVLPTVPSPALLAKARKVAPGLDIYALYTDWQDFASRQPDPPKNLDAAFLGFCKKRFKSQD